MAITSLTRIVNERFVQRFQGIATDAVDKNNPTASFFEGSAASTSITKGLRFGAANFARSVQGLNAAFTAFNLADGALEKIEKIVDKAITFAEQASSATSNKSSRADLNIEYRALANDFTKIIDETKFGSDEVLTEEGLTSILEKVGLSPETSSDVATLFKQFVFALGDSDKYLASEDIKGQRPVNIPAQAYTNSARTSYDITSLFDESTDILTRPHAYVVLNDLKAAKEQITKNQKILSDTKELIDLNIELARGAGFAFLDLSNTVSDSQSAEEVAQLLRTEIRKNAAGALSQAANLEPLTVAALVLDQSTFK